MPAERGVEESPGRRSSGKISNGENNMRIRWRNFEFAEQGAADAETLTNQYGRFYIEPFERGFGHTDRQRPAPRAPVLDRRHGRYRP
jgi:hypothetical protein